MEEQEELASTSWDPDFEPNAEILKEHHKITQRELSDPIWYSELIQFT